MTFGSEISPAFLLQLVGTGVALVWAWADMKSRVNTAEARAVIAEAKAASAEASAKGAHDRLTLHQEGFALYREMQAKELVSREILREVETRISGYVSDVEKRLGGRLDGIGNRLDEVHDRLIDDRRLTVRPPV